ncbi:aryl-sulfate sulfotransferase [Halosimplex pelagicum]|uniref:Aryl-sulfate sulfotransferase n=1 Tax=Halosimplex pelagicum TaxID=869886 RepID=A0A7D5TJ29_9EURY|nr:aryl-sulfate sulfotransferase [Halosimplex pelagicum]QLH84496.1 aryl-sulfate sulfotransferase [Halosimplex pelagicum]
MRRTVLSTLLVALLLAVPVAGATGGVAGAADRSGAGAAPAVDPGAAALQQASNPCVGTMEQTPDRTTLFSIQGARGGEKTSAMVVGARPNGSIVGVHNDSDAGRWWSYDIDVLDNGNILQATTDSRDTLIEEIDPETGEHLSERRFENAYDTHDVDLINGDELLMNDMSQDGEDRVLIYNLTQERVTWEYYFANYSEHYPKSGGGEFGGDWTHNNDVEQIRDGVIMVSVRNFDKVVAIDRETKELRWELGSDDNTSILHEQHNPDYLSSEDGSATVIVADSLNDRVVEYEREGDSWNQTWVLRGGRLSEPRDADRLPNGNTLIADRRAHRIVEVTPDGEVVWEVYSPYQPYDVERIGTGDESSGPTMADIGEGGVVESAGGADFDTADIEACYDYLTGFESSRLIPEEDMGAVGASPTATEGEGTTGGGSGDGADGDASDGDDTESGSNGDSVLGTPTSGSGPTPLGTVLAVGAVVALVAGALVRLKRD